MLQAHSILWNYLWVAPNVLLLGLGVLLLRRRIDSQFPVFLAFVLVMGLEQLALFIADVVPRVSPIDWWRIFWASLLLESLLKFALIGELFGRVFGIYSSVARLGRNLITSVGVVLVFVAAVVAAYTPKDNKFWIVSGAHILQQATYTIECGLLLFLFVFAAYFELSWGRHAFGIALGLSVSACVHLATWALLANGNFSSQYRVILDFVNMAAYHICVLIWFYYFLVPPENAREPRENMKQPPVPPLENSLDVWNREVERLLHQ